MTFHVDVEVPKRLDIDTDSFDLGLNKSCELKLYAAFADGTREWITDKAQWSSDHTNIADVIKSKVTGYKSGTATIKDSYSGKEATAIVRVDIRNQIVLSKTTVDKQIGESMTLTANANYSDNRVVDVSALAQWSSAHPNVIEVNKGTTKSVKIQLFTRLRRILP
ncbi:hypothetical protein [Bacillus sp. FJAT-26390]|uniref:hypothetical protein n=1 Tax=Bacillus sp. FJAT-26390 TaxID=1743142 RepID=UPI00080801A6|nr:hypothetical protein [Bacillus sp. FJAT-26390]OBZ16380.1 hypothetical protein A7975_00100 [Bacillus sp. FJAT-26390]